MPEHPTSTDMQAECPLHDVHGRWVVQKDCDKQNVNTVQRRNGERIVGAVTIFQSVIRNR